MLVAKILEFEEGFRERPYLCSEGYVTVGYGFKLHTDQGLDPEKFLVRVSRETATEWLNSELGNIQDALMRSHVGGVDGIYHQLRAFPNRRAIILSMAYQMGVQGTLNFHGMWAAIALNNWEDAAKEMLDSKWARQTPERAERHATVMRTGILTSAYPRGTIQ